MRAIKAIREQIWRIIIRDKYPSIYIPLTMWTYKIEEGKVRYAQWRTLCNYIKSL